MMVFSRRPFIQRSLDPQGIYIPFYSDHSTAGWSPCEGLESGNASQKCEKWPSDLGFGFAISTQDLPTHPPQDLPK